MNKNLLSICIALLIGANLFGQFVSDNKTIVNMAPVKTGMKKVSSRSATNPKTCDTDTSYFANLSTSIASGSYQYRSLNIGTGQGLGQFFGAPTTITVSGFRFYGYFIYDTVTKVKSTYVKCNLYKAGSDSLPTGSALATTTIKLDTINGPLYLNKIMRDVSFSTPVACNFPYIITVESDSTSSKPGIVSNAWQYGDGEGRNLAVGSVSGKWYRCLQLNIGGVSFDAHMQIYPFVSYKFGTDFTSNINCYNVIDTIRLTNSYKSNVGGSVYYNQYQYYDELGLGYNDYCHTWVINGSTYLYNQVDAKLKSSSKSNINVALRSMVVPYKSGLCYDTTVKDIYFKPAIPGLFKAANGCIGDSLRMTLTGDAGVTMNWFKKQTDATPFHKGISYTISNVQKADTFYVRSINGPCSSGFLTIYQKASAYPTSLTSKNDSICSSALANLVATTNIGLIEWYTAKTGGTKLSTGNTFQTSQLYADTAFYAQANNNGCIYKGGRATVKAFVGSSYAPSLPTNVKDTSVCFSSSSTVKISATPSSGASLRWYDVPLGSTPLSTGNTYDVIVNSRGTQTFYVECWNGICGSGRTAVNIVGAKYPSTFTRTNATICSGDSATVGASTLWGNIDWYTSKTGSIVSNQKNITLQGLTNNINYIYYKTRENNCVSPNFDSVKVTVNTPPTVTKVTNNNVCQKGLGAISVEMASGNINWYTDETSTSTFATGKTVSLGQMWSNVTLYYVTESNGCYGVRTPVTVKALPRPTAGFTWTLAWPRIVSCTPITTAGMTFSWNWGDGNSTTGLPAKHTYTTDGDYIIKLVTTSTSNGCTDTADIPVSVNHVSTKNISNPTVSVYPNPIKNGTMLNIQGINATEIHWYDVSGREVAAAKVIDNTTVVPTKLNAGLYWIKGGNNEQTFKASIYINN